MKNTPLSAVHESLGGRMVEFAGFSMPVQYSSIMEEHEAVRTKAGLFDLFHMGEFWLNGPDALKNVQKIVTNDIEALSDRQIAYTPMCRPDGSIVDDLLVYRWNPEKILLVVNASNMQKDEEWIRSQLFGNVTFDNHSDRTGLIAIQGPKAQEILQKLTRQNLKAIKYYWFTDGVVNGVSCIISRTGYTGEDGFELYYPHEQSTNLWNALMAAGSDLGLRPIGLGARDTLRLEARLMLYGNDIHDGTNPIEANLDWTVKFAKGDFNGSEVLKQQKEHGVSKTLVGFDMARGPAPRHGYPIFHKGKKVGEVTSGTMAPTLKKNIGLGYVPRELKAIGSEFEVEIRGKMHPARVIETPFYAKKVAKVETLSKVDPQIAKIVVRERDRQMNGIELIASENFVSEAVMEAMGSVLTNKYAEGYPGKRYYGGCEVVDEAENLARDRVKQLFGAEHANVQPHSGSQANMAVYMATMQPGDTYLGMNLSNGGHLTHGSPVNFSGMLYKAIPYGVDAKSETIDYKAFEKLAKEHKPKLIMSGASAYPRIIDFKRIREICDSVGALMVVDMAHIAGLVAAGLHPSPVPMADFVTSTTHKTLRGPRGGLILCKEKYAKAVDKLIFPGIQGGPLMHVIAAKAVAFQEALLPSFKDYQKRILANAQALADALKEEGFRLVSGGTDNHLMLVDLRPKKITGKDAEKALDKAGITVNKNTIPNDPESPFVTSGLRLGTPAITTRGMLPETMKDIARLINEVLTHHTNDDVIHQVRVKVQDLCERFPLYATKK